MLGLEGVICELETSFSASERAIEQSLAAATKKNRSTDPNLDDPVNEQLERQGTVHNEGICFFSMYIKKLFPYRNEDGAKDFFAIVSETTYCDLNSLEQLQDTRHDLYEINPEKAQELKERIDTAKEKYKPKSLARRILYVSPYELLFKFKKEL